MDDTFVIQKEVNKQDFLQHINIVDPTIQFTVENNKEDDAIPFLHTTVKPEADGNLSITVYKKPTHMDQYLQRGSHHHLSAKFSVINTLTHRAKTVCSNPVLLCREWIISTRHSPNVNTQNGFQTRWRKGSTMPSSEVIDGANNQGTTSTQPTTNEDKTKGHIVIPCTQGLCKALKRSVRGMAYRPTSKVVAPSRTCCSPQGQRPHGQQKWGHILVPMW